MMNPMRKEFQPSTPPPCFSQVQPRSEDEPYVLATLDYVFERNPYYTVLGQNDME